VLGNKADVSGNDLLQCWENDIHARVIAMCPSRSAIRASSPKLAQRIRKPKPLVIVKSGHPPRSARVVAHGSGCRTRGGDRRAAPPGRRDARVQHRGDDSRPQGIDGRAHPRRNRLCIITNAAAPIMAADAADESRPADRRSPTRQAAHAVDAARRSSVENPIDMIASASDQYGRFFPRARTTTSTGDPDFRPAADRRAARGDASHHARGPRGKTVLSVLMADESYYARIRAGPDPVPYFRYPEDAVKVAEHMNRYRLARASRRDGAAFKL
jgi:acyl-CoA synthetase (NDP forming)